MSKVLVSILSERNDILSSSHLFNSIMKENPHTEIAVIAYDDQKSILNNIANISKIYTIDRNYINSISESALYSEAFGLNSLLNSLEECIDSTWDKVINFSNDNVSSYLCSMFNAKEVIGTTISQFGSPKTTNNWSTYFNFVTPNMGFDIISKNTVRHEMAGTPFHLEGTKFKSNDEYSAIATSNFAKIRKTKEGTNNANIVGISLMQSFQGKEIDLHSLVEVVEALEASENFRAVLILSGTEREKQIANELNHKFDNSLISVNTDLMAVPSVLMNIDYLISTNNDHLMIADSLDTRIIEVRAETSQRQNCTVINPGNFVVFQKETTSVANDIILILNEEFETELPITSMNSDNAVYAMIEDDYGILMTQIRGQIDIQKELRYHIERCYHFQLMGYPVNKELMSHIKTHTDKSELKEFVNQTKEELTDSVKTLLAALRSLKGVKQSKTNLHNFISYLDNLIRRAYSDSITRGPIGIFEGNIENIDTTNSEENMKAIEKNLFKLKNDLQLLTNILTDLVSAEESSAVREQNSSSRQVEL